MTTPPRQFQHLILTRFNPTLAGDGRGLDPGWLSHRLGVFRGVCVPSVARQTNQQFTWLVFCDRRTPRGASQELRQLAESCCFEIVWCDGPFDERTAASAVVQRLDEVEHVLTTRLDNDDALAPEFVERLQQRFAPAGRHFINFPNGLQLADRQTYARFYLGSPFLSLVETASTSLRTVYSTDHWRPREHRAEQVLTRSPAWLQVVHAHNLANDVQGLWVRPSRAAAFALPAEMLAAEPSRTGVLAKRLSSAVRLLRPGDLVRRARTLLGASRRCRAAG